MSQDGGVAKGTGSNPVSQYPAETSALTGAVVFLVAWVFGIKDVGVVCALGVVFGSVPAAITWLVTTIRARRGEIGIVLPVSMAQIVAPAPPPGG